jgi:hypothetical protein
MKKELETIETLQELQGIIIDSIECLEQEEYSVGAIAKVGELNENLAALEKAEQLIKEYLIV